MGGALQSPGAAAVLAPWLLLLTSAAGRQIASRPFTLESVAVLEQTLKEQRRLRARQIEVPPRGAAHRGAYDSLQTLEPSLVGVVPLPDRRDCPQCPPRRGTQCIKRSLRVQCMP